MHCGSSQAVAAPAPERAVLRLPFACAFVYKSRASEVTRMLDAIHQGDPKAET
jgi:hypothetical protein